MYANAATPPAHTTRIPRSVRSACAAGDESRRRRGSARVACRNHAGADVAAGGDARGGGEQKRGREDREQQHERVRAGERAQLLSPAERRRPAQPAGAACGVGDHPQQEQQPDGRAAELERDAARRRELARDSADADAHRHDRRRRQGRGRPSRRRAVRPGRSRRTRPARAAGCPRAIAASAARFAVRRPTGPGQHELQPARLLLGPQRAHRCEQAEDGGGDRQRPADAPGGVAADRHDVAGLAVEEPERPCCRRSCGRTRAGRRVSGRRGGSRPAGRRSTTANT